MFCILVKEKQFGHEEYFSGWVLGLYVYIPPPSPFLKSILYMLCTLSRSTTQNTTLTVVHNQWPVSLYMYLYFYQLHYSPNKVSSGVNMYGIEWLFFQRKDHLNTIKKTKCYKIHPIFHTCN